MGWIKGRLVRARGYWGFVAALATGSALMIGVAALMADRFRLFGLVGFLALLLGGFALVTFMPERAWNPSYR